MRIKPAAKNGGVLVKLGPLETQLPSGAGDTSTPVTPVFRLENILVPVDFSECTEKALSYAVPFAQQSNATLTLLHVIEPPYLPASEMGVVVEYDSHDEVSKELEGLRARIAGKARCRTMIREGRAESEIVDAAQELGSDLIILSTHGRTGFERLLMGSTVEKVVRRAGCPILVVRPHEHDFIARDPMEGRAGHEGSEAKVESMMKAGM